MRTWVHVKPTESAVCGRCNTPLPTGTPVLLIALKGVRLKRLRCEACVGEVPPDLPVVVELSRQTKPMVSLNRVARRWTFDYKAAQVGQDAPGTTIGPKATMDTGNG